MTAYTCPDCGEVFRLGKVYAATAQVAGVVPQCRKCRPAVAGREVEVEGVLYASQADAARALGVSRARVCQYMRRARELTAGQHAGQKQHAIGLGRRAPDPVTIRGIYYPSQKAAAEALCLSEPAISTARRAGRLDTVGLQARHVQRRAEKGRS